MIVMKNRDDNGSSTIRTADMRGRTDETRSADRYSSTETARSVEDRSWQNN